jgi:hypothetical protein
MTSRGLVGFECKRAVPVRLILIVVTVLTLLREYELELDITLGATCVFVYDLEPTEVEFGLLFRFGAITGKENLALPPGGDTGGDVGLAGLAGMFSPLMLLPPTVLAIDARFRVRVGFMPPVLGPMDDIPGPAPEPVGVAGPLSSDVFGEALAGKHVKGCGSHN